MMFIFVGNAGMYKIVHRFNYMVLFTCLENSSMDKDFGQIWLYGSVRLFRECQYVYIYIKKNFDRCDYMALFTYFGGYQYLFKK